jgi:signal transduction histidine kinase
MRAAQSPEPIVVPDTLQDPNWQVVSGLEDVRSFACAPILVDGELVGFINIDGDRPGALKPEIAHRLHILAQQAGIAIKNARLYEQTRQRAEELKRRVDSLTITQQVYKELGFSFDSKLLLELAFDAILRLTRAEAGYVALSEDGILKVARLYGKYTQSELTRLLKKQDGIIGVAIEERRVQVALPPTPVISAFAGAQAQMALPLYARDGGETDSFYGVMVVETARAEYFTEDRAQLAGLIAGQVAVALQNVRLVETVRERAAELETLYERVSKLEQLKSDMIRIAAHDLKNPLTVVINYMQLLMEGIELDTGNVYPRILQAGQRMLQIIQDFLSLDRIEMAAEQQTTEDFNLCDIVKKAVDEFRERAAQKSQQFEANLPETACIINGDPVQVYEAVTNFISNAVKYTPDGGHITVELAIVDDFARLEVRDTGYGIPEDKQSKLFQPFSRARTRETRDIEGTGLGLHLTKNIVERQGGTIIFHSEYKKGSTFGFQLPLREMATVEDT